MHRNTRMVVAGLGATMILSAAAAPAALASDVSGSSTTSVRVAQERGLLDGLLGGLTGTTSTTTTTSTSSTISPDQLTSLVNTVLTLPGADTLGTTAVTSLVTSVLDAGVAPDPTVVSGLLDGVLQSAGTSAAPTSLVTDLVSGLLSQGVVSDLTGVVNGLLSQTGTAPVGADLVTGIVNGLLAGGLPTDPSSLLGLLNVLESGAVPTGALLGPVTDLLDQFAANPALPQPLRDAVAQLSAAVKSAGTGTLPDDLLRSVGGVLGVLGGNDAVAKPVQDALGLLSGLLLGSSKPNASPQQSKPGQTKYVYGMFPNGDGTKSLRRVALGDMRARVSRVQVNKRRNRATVTLNCPLVAVLGCDVRVKPTLQSRVAGATKRVMIVPGQRKKVTLALTRSSSRRAATRGGRLAARATTVVGGRSYNASRMLQLGKKHATKSKHSR